MSSRHLRRILEQRERKLEEQHAETEADDSFENGPSKGSSLFSAVAFQDEVEEMDEPEVEADDVCETKPEATLKTTIQVKKKPKKKNKKNEIVITDEVDEVDEEEFEAALRQIQAKQPDVVSADPEAQEDEEWCRLVKPDPDRIDPMAELKKKIGSFQMGSEAADARFANLIERISPAKQTRINMRRKGKNQLIAMQPSWPIVPAQATGLKVDWSQENDCVMVEHSEVYRNGLSMAIPLIRQADIDGLLILVRNVYPYHVDALLVLSDYVRMSGQSTEAAELVEWCLHLLDKSCKGSAGGGGLLSITKKLPNSFPYVFPPSRKVHLALFRHTQNLLRRGCWRTALECGKLLLFWDFSDELFSAPLLICAALHAGEHDWLQAMAQFYLGSEDELPGYRLLWSAALALSQMLQGASDGDSLFVASILAWPELKSALLEDDKVDVHCDPHRLAMARLFLVRMEAILKDQRLAQLKTLARGTPTLESGESANGSDPFDWVPLYRHVLMSDLTLRVAMPSQFRDLNTYDPISPESVERSSSAGLIGALAMRLQNLFR